MIYTAKDLEGAQATDYSGNVYTAEEYKENCKRVHDMTESEIAAIVPLTASKGAHMYVCPVCHSGEGPKGTGALCVKYSENSHCVRWRDYAGNCFGDKGCDNLEALQITWNTDAEGVFKRIGYIGTNGSGTYKPKKQQTPASPKEEEKEKEKPEVKDYTNFFKMKMKQIRKTDYLLKRGISYETAEHFLIGYWDNFIAGKDENGQTIRWEKGGILIPTSANSYVVRNTDTESEDRLRDKGAKELFNIKRAYKATRPIYVVEGEIDALSIYEATGSEAIGLGGIGQVDRLLQHLKEEKPEQPLIIALDNEEAGSKTEQKVSAAEEKLAEGLEALNIPYVIYKPYGEDKDANAALQADKAAFIKALQKGEELANKELRKSEEAEEIRKQEERDAYEKESAAGYLPEMQKHITDSKTAAFYPTGFLDLDKVLDGGLYSGLYIIGAISSLGKTTFGLQVMDHIAKQGKDVIIFSLEMSKDELIAKTISRETAIASQNKYEDFRAAKTTRGILDGKRYENYTAIDMQTLYEAYEAYGDYDSRIHIYQSIADTSTKEIKAAVQKHIDLYGEERKPVVLIDYLQIIKTPDVHLTDKAKTDQNVNALKMISAQYGITIIAISSFNRESYNDTVSMSSFKESGAVEYSSDVLIGLQYKDMKEAKGDKDNVKDLIDRQTEIAEKGEAQNIIVKVLKNRNGTRGEAELDFYPKFNYFCTHTEQPTGIQWNDIANT